MTTAEIVTLLFTDLVGSTELFQRIGDDAAETIRRTHFQLLREAVSDRGGHEVKNLGDGLMVVFPSALDALACAVAIQRAVREHNHRGKEPAFTVRVGLQVGEPIRDEDDYFGTPVIESLNRIVSGPSGNFSPMAAPLDRGPVIVAEPPPCPPDQTCARAPSFRDNHGGTVRTYHRSARRGARVQPKTRYAKSGGVSIAYQVLGEGPLDVVFIPGFVSNVEFW